MISAKTSLNRAALKGGAATFVLAMLASPVAGFAQTAATTAAAADAGDETIVVTGSLIKNPNLVLSSPVNVVSAKEIETRQINNAELLIRDLPGVVPGVGSAVNNGNGGASFVNLRGLGAFRNLALIDGDRLVPANQTGQFDLNNVPIALVQRVDILTGGASTTYGADAVSGVVNFITKQDFSGVDLRVTNGLTEKGDGYTFRADLTVGGNFADGRGNAVLSFGYQKADPIYQGARDISVFQVNSANGRAAGGSPTDSPTSFYFTGNEPAARQNNSTGSGFVTANPDGFNFAPYNVFQTPFERFNMFAQAKYEIFDGIEVYGRGMFSKNSVTTIIAPSGIFGEALNVNINNPYISAGQRTEICAANPSVADCTTTSTATVPIAAVYRRTTELGPRVSEYVTTLFDYKVGIRGDFTDRVHFDVSGAYGQSNNTQSLDGYTLRSRVQQALLADNTTTCRTATNGCVPLNLFGPAGSITDAQANFLRGKSYVGIDTSLSQLRGIVSGDFGVASPGASNPISFAVGTEYRNYGYSRNPDSLSQVAGELGGGGGSVLPFAGGYSVFEGFAEANVPIVEDKPFFQSLSLDLGIRQSHYKVNNTNNSFDATTFKVGGSWAPVADLKLRGGYARAVRAPNIDELFRPLSTGLTSLATDPCSGSKPVGNATLTAVCLAQGANAAQIGNIQDPAASQANSTVGGNINLRPETADTFTVGGVLTPAAVPGLSLTVDYFSIVINNAITNPTPSDVITACFGSVTAASATDPNCTIIRRNPATGRLSGPTGTVAGLPQPFSNLGRIKTSGIDFSAAYQRDVGFANLGLSFNGTYTFENKFKATPTSINRECVGFYSVNCSSQGGGIQPKFMFNQRTTLDFDQFNVSLLWRHIDPVRYETILAPRFSGAITGFGPLVGQVWNFNRIKSYDYFDLAAGFNVMENIQLNLLVSNLFNRQPPVVGSTLGALGQNSGNTYPSTYDVQGRRYTATIGVRF